ncbi:hypothetical protein ACFX2C_005399 [Malus domestica]
MKELFKSKPRTPADIVRQTWDLLVYAQRAPDSHESKREEKLFVAGISAGDVSWPTSTQLPWRLAPVEGCYRASASFLGVCRASLVGQDSSGKAEREGHR